MGHWASNRSSLLLADPRLSILRQPRVTLFSASSSLMPEAFYTMRSLQRLHRSRPNPPQQNLGCDLEGCSKLLNMVHQNALSPGLDVDDTRTCQAHPLAQFGLGQSKHFPGLLDLHPEHAIATFNHSLSLKVPVHCTQCSEAGPVSYTHLT